MKLAKTIPVGGFTTIKVESSDRSSVQECARDLVQLLEPQVTKYPTLRQEIDQIKQMYGIS